MYASTDCKIETHLIDPSKVLRPKHAYSTTAYLKNYQYLCAEEKLATIYKKATTRGGPYKLWSDSLEKYLLE